MSSRTIIALFFFATAGVAQAQVTPLIFERENIRIESPAPSTIQTASPKDAAAPSPVPHAPLTYDVEIRPEDALRLEYIHSLNSLNDSTGVMIAFTAPSVVPLPAWQTPTAVDALFVSNNGTIVQILPNVVLADLKQDIMAQVPIKAFLFLRAGSAAARGIHPQDVVVSKKFIPAPAFLK